MSDLTGRQPVWMSKYIEGKMFQRLECNSCGVRFNFGDNARATRVPRCPACGSWSSHPQAA